MKREIFLKLFQRLKEEARYIQVVLGPRQTGKTTGILQLKDEFSSEYFVYVNADSVFSDKRNFLIENWQKMRLLRQKTSHCVLAIDEVQSIENWSMLIKGLWDEDKANNKTFHVVLLGSSSLELHRGLSESLAGRFEQILVPHWSFSESKKLLPSLTFDEYLEFGGYPAPLEFSDIERKKEYIVNSILNPVITKDILQNVTVKKPALFRQTFEIVCMYAAEILSLNKFLGQLQESGNVDLVKHYLKLYEQAFLIYTLEKFSTNKLQKKGSSPKLMPRAPVFLNLFGLTDKGRKFELVVGLHLIQKYKEVYYWKDGKYEVDFVVVHNNKLIAVEVKSGRKRDSKSLVKFQEQFNAKCLIITLENFEFIDDLI